MKRKWFIIAVLFPAFSYSQESSSRSSLHAIASLGVVAGESTAKPLFQLTSGFYYKKWFAGIGAGLDYYNLKSIPVFADYKICFGKKESYFLYANGGYNFPFGNKTNDQGFIKPIERYYGGLYVDAGLGCRIRLSSHHRLLFSAGYSRKDIFRNVEYTFQGTNPPTEQKYNYHYMFGRIAAKLGWEFGK
jgi:hypothetical protein